MLPTSGAYLGHHPGHKCASVQDRSRVGPAPGSRSRPPLHRGEVQPPLELLAPPLFALLLLRLGALTHTLGRLVLDIGALMASTVRPVPTSVDWKAALEVVKYLKGTADYGVVYGRQQDGIPYVPLCAYSDASWADDPDDRTSRAGIMLWSWGGPIEWRSNRQKSQALSSCEAEYGAAAYACISRPSSEIPPPSSEPFLLYSASSSGDFLTVPVENLKFYFIL